MKKQVQDFFTFDKRGRKGITILIIVFSIEMLALWSLNFYNPLTSKFAEPVLIDTLLLDSLSKLSKKSASNYENDYVSSDLMEASGAKQVKRFYFNPNTATDAEWIALGLKEYQIKKIRNYFKSGGHIDYPDEVLKLRAVKKEVWNDLIPYIVLEDKKRDNLTEKPDNLPKKIDSIIDYTALKEERNKAQRESFVFEINSCTKWNFYKLQLIDSTLADQIVKYKLALGGLHNLNQLYEVQNFDSAAMSKLKPHLTIDARSIKTININACSSLELSRHPYFSYNVAVALVNYRSRHGKYKQIDDLKNCLAMNDKLLKKVEPYLRFNDN